MINTIDLFSGIGVIVDDDLAFEKKGNGDQIWRIKTSFEEHNIPLLLYTELPNGSECHFDSISFLLLDWDLLGLEAGIPLPEPVIADNIAFIKAMRECNFVPIFIFSNEDPNSIIQKLQEADLYKVGDNNHIFVKGKNELDDSKKLFSEIESWLKNTPSIYVLKEWEKALKRAKHNLFWDFYEISPDWPMILQDTFEEDGVDKNFELNAVIFKNLIARTSSVIFDNDVLKVDEAKVSKKELRQLLECERLLTRDIPQIPSFGDLYKLEYLEKGVTKYSYWINIRPDCDILRQGEDVELYCIKGRVVDESKINSEGESNIIFEKGELREKTNNAYVSFIDGGKIIEFQLRCLKIRKWSDLRENRIGRLLPPYITRLQQKYLFYLQRQALPAIPAKAIV